MLTTTPSCALNSRSDPLNPAGGGSDRQWRSGCKEVCTLIHQNLRRKDAKSGSSNVFWATRSVPDLLLNGGLQGIAARLVGLSNAKYAGPDDVLEPAWHHCGRIWNIFRVSEV